MDGRYRLALLDWLACAVGGAGEPASRTAKAAGDGVLERVAFLGAAGHVLDFDDTYLPGIAHLSAPVAPAALAVAAAQGATIGDALTAYAAGVEAMGAVARASHPALYERGWHPTAVCGAVGAAVAASRLLELEPEREEAAARLALLGAGGLRAAFGSDGKALQVGMAAAQGVQAARLAAGGATASATITDPVSGFAIAYGGSWAGPDATEAIEQNWIKPWPCCLMAHSAIEAAATLRAERDTAVGDLGDPAVTVHPRARQAAAYDDVADGLQAKFSIPYLVADTLLRGEPTVQSFADLHAPARELARRITVSTDASLGEAEARLSLDGDERAPVVHSIGSPQRPLDSARLAAKVRDLAGERLQGILDDPGRPAAEALAAAGL